MVDDLWATIGSDNFNRRSWTHDSELSAVVVDESAEDHSPFGRRLRLSLAAEHLDRDAGPETETDALLETMADCMDAPGMFEAYAESARRLDAWHEGGEVGERPPGRLRKLEVPRLSRLTRAIVTPAYLLLHDPDGRPRPLRRKGGY